MDKEKDIKAKVIKKIIENKIIIAILFSIIGILISICFFYMYNNQNEEEFNQDFMYEDNNEDIEKTKEINNIETEKQNEIIIHIAGEVKNPGVYTLPENSRISDAINIAGGITVNADLTNVNLAYLLLDAQKIKIPCINDTNNGNNNFENDEKIIYSNENKTDKVNINTSDITLLTSLPGIGESTAQKIIQYREANGKYKTIEDIKNVSGIGESKFEKIKDFIKVK